MSKTGYQVFSVMMHIATVAVLFSVGVWHVGELRHYDESLDRKLQLIEKNQKKIADALNKRIANERKIQSQLGMIQNDRT